jgi:DNA-binding NarL/FixJ family response regulator
LSASDDEDVIERCLDAGALCFVGKSVKPEDIAHALRSVCGDLQISYRGKRAVRRNVTEGPVPAQAQLLTKREREILSILANGGSNSEIARGLWVTEQTVKFHLSNIYRKLEVSNRTQAARRGSQLGLVDLTSDSDRATDSASSGI